jgi:alpha-mannosidase
LPARSRKHPTATSCTARSDTATSTWHGWPLRETHRKSARTYTRALNTIETRDGYIYGTSQPQQMQWMKFDTQVDWHESHRMLRAQFFPTHYGDTARSEIQFGHIERTTTEKDAVDTAQFEVVAHKWIATEDGRGGFALLNDGKYANRAKNGLISLNLPRSPTFPDKTADRGIHRFSYATVDDPGVIIETIKPAESGNGVVIRLYESLGRRTTTALRVAFKHTATQLTDLLENPIGTADLSRLEFTPFEITTILLEPR